ncbi:MAG: rhodanese-like domain-containing protein [Pseudomonadota bacterium]
MIFKRLILAVLLMPLNLFAASTLWMTETMINLRFDVENISHQDLQKIILDKAKNNTIVFDVRRPEEYQRSRIKGSIQVDPEMKAEDFISKFGNKFNHKELVFYCSVGYRSSVFIERIEKQAKAVGVNKMHNLAGGIFRWYNEHLQLVNDQGDTDDIHPSDESWAHLIEPRVRISHD